MRGRGVVSLRLDKPIPDRSLMHEIEGVVGWLHFPK